MKNQKGFSAVEVILILVIVLILGGVMYFVYNANEESKTQNDSAQSTQNQQKSDVPAGFKEYKNEEFGISFTYPGKYSETTDANLSSDPDIAKDQFYIGFSSTKYGLFVQSSKKDPAGGDSPCLFNVRGFNKQGDKYYYTNDDKTEEIYRLDNKNDFEVVSPKAVIWNEESGLQGGSYVVICSAVNLENSEFEGIGLQISINNGAESNKEYPKPVEDVSKEDIKAATDELKAIVKSFKQI